MNCHPNNRQVIIVRALVKHQLLNTTSLDAAVSLDMWRHCKGKKNTSIEQNNQEAAVSLRWK